MDHIMSNWWLRTLGTYGLLCFAILNSGCGSIKEGIGGAASMVGLGNSEAYEEGKTYFDAQAYDQAIQKFEQALGDSPGDTDIQRDLAKAKSLAAAQHFDRGKELSGKHEINGALIAFGKAKTYQPQNVTYVARYQEEKGKYDKLKTDMERTVLEVGETKQWDEGLQTLATMKRYESSFPELATHVQEIRHKAAQYHEGRSDEKLTQQDFQGAAQEIEKAAEYDPSSRHYSQKQGTTPFIVIQASMGKK